MSEVYPILFEVISVDGAIEKRDPDELISYGEMQTLNEELLAFLEERGYGFGGVMRGIVPTRMKAPPPPPQSKDSGVCIRDGGRPVPMPTKAVHPLETIRRGFFDWWTLAAMLVVVAVVVTAAVVIAL